MASWKLLTDPSVLKAQFAGMKERKSDELLAVEFFLPFCICSQNLILASFSMFEAPDCSIIIFWT